MMDVVKWIEDHQDRFIEIADKIWNLAEVRYQESGTSELLSKTLEEAGFLVARGIADIPTAFVACYGSGKPVIALIGEYDALEGLSQDRVPVRQPLVEGGNGHGCGHNLIGAGSLAAALAVKEAIQAGEIRGTLRYYGCPAEEGGSAKTFMVRAGVFDGVDISMGWHPGTLNSAPAINLLARFAVFFKFHGQTAHAAFTPHLGRSALDAVELMNVGVNYLREHIIPEARVHYVITNGGRVPNIVPSEAESWYYIRAPRVSEVRVIHERIVDVARGAALMTGTEVEVEFYAGISEPVLNYTIAGVLQDKLAQVGPIQFTDVDKAFAQEISTTMSPVAEAKLHEVILQGAPESYESIRNKILIDEAIKIKRMDFPGSSDMADISWVVPNSWFWATCFTKRTQAHSWQTVAQVGMGIGHKGMILAGKTLALAVLEFLEKPALVEQAKAELAAHLKETPYVSPLPEGSKPPIDRHLTVVVD
jgi:aminobenzoyl-glutamate utilization protein B